MGLLKKKFELTDEEKKLIQDIRSKKPQELKEAEVIEPKIIKKKDDETDDKELVKQIVEKQRRDERKQNLEYYFDEYGNTFAASADNESVKLNILFGILIELKKLNESEKL
jgi:hypothetical protein